MPEPITNTGYKLPEGCFNYMDLSKYNSSRKKDEDMIRHIRECGECSERLKTIKTARYRSLSHERTHQCDSRKITPDFLGMAIISFWQR